MPRLIRAARAGVSTSAHEGFGVPPLESMAAEMRVGAVRAPAVEELCATAAVLVEGDAAVPADSLVRVMDDAALRHPAEVGLRRPDCLIRDRAADARVAVYREPGAT